MSEPQNSKKRRSNTKVVAILGGVAALLTALAAVFTSLRKPAPDHASSSAARSTPSQSIKSGDSSANVQIGTARDISISQSIAHTAKELDEASLQQIDVGVHRDFVEQTFGKPVALQKLNELLDELTDLPSSITYVRYDGNQCEMQVLYNDAGEVTAFTVRVFPDSGISYHYVARPVNWILGQTSCAGLGDPKDRFQSWDAKFVSYNEEHYFGRWGHYNHFFFSAPWLGGDLSDGLKNIDRSAEIPNAVLVATDPKKNMTEKEQQAWETAIRRIIEVHGTRFEGL